MTDDEKKDIVNEVLSTIRKESTDVASLDQATSLENLSGLPAVDADGKLLTAPLTLLTEPVDETCKSIKAQVDASVISASGERGASKVTITMTKNSGATQTLDIPSATSSIAGVMSATDKAKLDGIAEKANNYSLPTASASTLGGVKVGSNLAISNGVLRGDYKTATTSADGLLSKTDKANLDRSVYDVDVNAKGEAVEFSFLSNDGSTAAIINIDAATTSSAGVMSATDKGNLDALKKKADTVPTSLEVVAPSRITKGNVNAQYVKATILPEECEQNIIYQTDGDSIHMEPDGQITVKGTGKTRIHVIPLEKTKLYKTVVVDVTEPWMRMTTAKAMRFDSTGNIRLI